MTTTNVIYDPANALLLRRQRALALAPVDVRADQRVPREHVATLLRNVASLGFTATPALVARLCTLDEARLSAVYAAWIRDLRALVGADVVWAPMYPDFPRQVMQASDAELFWNALWHYLGDALGVRILPDYEKTPRPPLADTFAQQALRPIDLCADADAALRDIACALIGANTSTSATDKADVATIIARFGDALEGVLPAEIRNKENLAFAAAQVLRHTRRADILLTRYFATATDVLRLATALSDGDVSLASNTRFRSFKRAERRLLLALLERVAAPLEDMVRHAERWKRLGERLHPGELRERFPKSASAFDAIRSGAPVETFGGRVEAALRDGDVRAALALLRSRPGELARRLDHLLRGDEAAQGEVVAAFEGVAERVSTPVLLQVLTHFTHRPEAAREADVRVFFPKGSVARCVAIPNDLPALDEAVCAAVVAACRTALLARFAELEPLGRVYLDPALAEQVVPFSQRSASKSLRTLVRGSALPLPDGETVRFFLWWKEGVVAGEHTGRVDVDLSAVLYDAQWAYKEHISYTNLRSAAYRAVHSGDITSAPDGACEFIDLDVASIVACGGRYVTMCVFSFTGQAFTAMPQCFAGWMSRQAPGSGEVFEPATVIDRVDLAADTRVSIPVILDLVARQVIWADLALTARPDFHRNVEANERGMAHMGRAMTSLRKPTLEVLFGLHAEARGERVASREEADTVFSLHEGVTPFDVETVASKFL